jgi:serine/threonine protein kinase
MSDSRRNPEGSARRAGEVHEGFELLEFVAEGPFSEVWRAERGDERVALKFARGEVGERMLAEEASLLERLANRNRAELRLPDSPNHVYPRVAAGALHFAPGSAEGPGCLATLWIPNGSLRKRLSQAESADERARVAAVFCDLAGIVGILHAQGVVHGDLKPENVLLQRTREGEIPYVIDFGLARFRREARLEQSLKASLQTGDALTGGTLAYMAPEIVKGGEPSAQADVYALGVMLHEALTGRRPSKVTTPEELRRKVPQALIPILLKALAYEPSERYQTAKDFAKDLSEQRAAVSATGVFRLTRSFGRFVLGGLAAFFVALRYVSVAILLASYALVVGTAVLGVVTGKFEMLAVLLFFIPIAALHGVIRWEGPETAEEASSRTAGRVVERYQRYQARQKPR